MRKNRAVVVLALVGVMLLHAGGAGADCAAPPPLDDALEAASIAFIGKVSEAAFESGQATLQVQWIWKGGELPAEVVVKTPPGTDGNPGYRFREGSTYIVIPQNAGVPLIVDPCSGTRSYRADGQDIPSDLQEAVGASSGWAPGSAASGGPADGDDVSTLPLIIALLAIIASATIGLSLYRSRHDAATESRRRFRGLSGLLSSGGRSGKDQVGRLRRRR